MPRAQPQRFTLKVFAYGSNMCTARLVERTPSARAVGRARLDGHRLRFHKLSRDGSAKADAFRTDDPSDRVWGVVFEIEAVEETLLDEAEGYQRGYDKRGVTVVNDAGERIVATMYYAEPKAIVDDLLPYTWYRNFVVVGSLQHGLCQVDEDYVAAVAAHDASRDPDASRERENAATARIAMWETLWADFRDRADRIAAGGAIGRGVDEVTAWQLHGHEEQVGYPLALEALHLPEIYSGSPWAGAGLPGGPQQGQWIALICGNPSIAPNGVHPMLDLWRRAGTTSVVATFDDRFHVGVRDQPLRHGRPLGAPVHWDGNPPRALVQDTWRQLEELIADALAGSGHGVAWPLGTAAAIADAVPWKFRAWNDVAEPTKVALMRAGAPYLRWFLQGGASGGRPPAIVAFLGSCARRTARLIAPNLPIEERVTRAAFQNLGEQELLPGVRAFVIVGPHPVDGANRFNRYRGDMLAALVEALA